MTNPRHVLYFAENALSAIQGGGIVAYAVLKGLPPDHLLGFYEYRNITPVPEYADRFTFLGGWRTPWYLDRINRFTKGRTVAQFHRRLTDLFIEEDFEFVKQTIEKDGFTPEVVYFAGLSYRYLRLAVMAAERYDIPMVQLNMDDWPQVECDHAGQKWGALWYKKIVRELTNASARSLVSTSNSPRLAARLSAMTGYRHVAANNCCADMMADRPANAPAPQNEAPVIVYAGSLNQHLQGETVKTLASAVAELNAEGTPVRLHIYTPWEFAPIANAINVPNAVEYKGQVGRDQLGAIYRAADFLVTTVTHRDCYINLFRHSLSTKLSEYLCAGRPVISMGHRDWHLHEYVQDNGCGFSIPIDENYSRAAIKAQLKRILEASPLLLARIGRRNRMLWERAHDVDVMALPTRRAIGLEPFQAPRSVSYMRRGVIAVGRTRRTAIVWLPLSKAKAIARRLVDHFEHLAVDLVGDGVSRYPELDALVNYCRDIGLAPTIVDTADLEDDARRWDPMGARWSLDAPQRTSDAALVEPTSVFDQVAALRATAPPDTPVQRAINQLTQRVSENAPRRPAVWFYGSLVLGQQVIDALESHSWLNGAVQIGGFVSSPGHCKASVLRGRPWRAVDALGPESADFIVVTSETSRLSIQEELARVGLLERSIPIFGLSGTLPSTRYERLAGGPGQAFVSGSTAHDYAVREILARTGMVDEPASTSAAQSARNAA